MVDNFGWDITLSVDNKPAFKTNKGTCFNTRVRVTRFAIIPSLQGIKRFKSKTRAKLSGLQLGGGGLRRRLQNFGKNNQENVEVQSVQKQQASSDEYAEFVEDVGGKTPVYKKYLESLNTPFIEKAREQAKNGRLGFFSK